MDWSAKQGHILTGAGVLEQIYTAPAFPFSEEELPHYHKLREGHIPRVFREWVQQGRRYPAVCGAWTRPLFVGGWDHSDNTSDQGEDVFNLQTPSLFIDIRIPREMKSRLRNVTGFESLTTDELSIFARRHAFAGYSLVQEEDGEPVCVRHHAIDWNFVGKLRSRPNKWRIEMREDGQAWKEWGYAKDKHGQHVYMERWERLPGSDGHYVALYREEDRKGGVPAAMIVVCGNHFNFIQDRITAQPFDPEEGSTPGLTALVDREVAAGNRRKILDYLSLRACHGLVDGGRRGKWVILNSLRPWEDGTLLFSPSQYPEVNNSARSRVKVWMDTLALGNERWVILENTLSRSQLENLFELEGSRTEDVFIAKL